MLVHKVLPISRFVVINSGLADDRFQEKCLCHKDQSLGANVRQEDQAVDLEEIRLEGRQTGTPRKFRP
jgi:hypothetical protein